MSLWLLVPGAYFALSTTLFFFPQLLHKRKRQAFHPRHISHRGGAGVRLENTMVAFEHAVALGTEMLELDVHLTRDKQVVVVHDSNLYRLCERNLRVCDLDYKDLPPLRRELKVMFSPDKPAVQSPDALPMPLLRDVFQRFPSVPINIDLKAHSEELVEEVAKLIEEHHRAHLTVVGSGVDSMARLIHARMPSVPMFFSGAKFFKFAVSFYLGLLPFLSFDEEFLEVPLPASLLHLSRTRTQAFLAYLFDATCMNRLILFHARRRGMQVLLWVLNDETAIRRAFAVGATGVMTDYPSLLSDVIADLDKASAKKD